MKENIIAFVEGIMESVAAIIGWTVAQVMYWPALIDIFIHGPRCF